MVMLPVDETGSVRVYAWAGAGVDASTVRCVLGCRVTQERSVGRRGLPPAVSVTGAGCRRGLLGVWLLTLECHPTRVLNDLHDITTVVIVSGHSNEPPRHGQGKPAQPR